MPKQTIAVVLFFLLTGCATSLKMAPMTTPELSHISQQPLRIGLFITDALKNYQYEIATSPFDRLRYPLGAQTVDLFTQCTETVYGNVVPVTSAQPSASVAFVIEPSIVEFNAVVPMPAYNPYTAKMIYRADVFDAKGNKIFTQTAVGEAQSSKGMMSGFSARTICAKVAQQAMQQAAVQIMEGLASADELKHP